MKKQLLTALTLCALALAPAANAQVINGYGMTVSTGGTMEILGPDAPGVTIVQSSAAESFEAQKYAYFYDGKTITEKTENLEGFEIGFDFKYGDKTMKYFGVSPAGYLVLREANGFTYDPTQAGNTFTTKGEEFNDILGITYNYCQITPDSYITFKTAGTSPNRKLYVQFHGIEVTTTSWKLNNVFPCNFQIMLSEADGSIEFMFSSFNDWTKTNTWSTVGLRTGYGEGVSATAPSSGDNKKNWEYAEKVVGLKTCGFGSGYNLPDGLTLKFTRPGDVSAPTTPATDLVLVARPDLIEYSFTESTDAQTYLIAYSEGDNTPIFPTDGKYYAVGDKLGDAEVLWFGPYPSGVTDRFIRDLKANTKYNVYVYACNSYGANGPQYHGSVLSGYVYTTPYAPTSIEVTSSTLNSVTGTCVSNEADNDVIVIYSPTLIFEDGNRGCHGDFGTPKGTYQVGDLVEEGHDGKIVYLGKAGEFTISDLPASTPVFLAVYTFDENGTYSYEYVDCNTSTSCELPYEPVLKQWTPRYDVPAGWKGEVIDYAVYTDVYDETTEEYVETFSYISSPGTMNGTEAAPKEGWLELPQIVVTQRFAKFSLNVCPWVWGRFGNTVYTCGENDYMALQISTDRETWTDLTRIDSTNQPEAPTPGEGETLKVPDDAYFPMEGILDDYVGQTIYLRFFFHNTQPVGVKPSLKNFKIVGDEIPEVPQVTVGEVTHNSAALTWRCDDTRFVKYEYGLIPNPCMDPTKAISGYTTDRAILFEDLEPNTEYLFSVRGIISEDPLDASEWGGEMFTTADWPEVEAPVPASDVVVTENSATVSWSENEDYLSFEIKYRAGSSTEWLSVTEIKENSYTFTGLEANTVYLWAVKAACTHERETVWSNQAQFTTAEAGIDNINANNFSVSCNEGVLNIVNKGVEIRAINLFDTTGRNIATYDVNSADNVMIPLNVVNGIYIVNIQNADGTAASYRVVR